jgi:hypothetical protein
MVAMDYVTLSPQCQTLSLKSNAILFQKMTNKKTTLYEAALDNEAI